MCISAERAAGRAKIHLEQTSQLSLHRTRPLRASGEISLRLPARDVVEQPLRAGLRNFAKFGGTGPMLGRFRSSPPDVGQALAQVVPCCSTPLPPLMFGRAVWRRDSGRHRGPALFSKVVECVRKTNRRRHVERVSASHPRGRWPNKNRSSRATGVCSRHPPRPLKVPVRFSSGKLIRRTKTEQCRVYEHLAGDIEKKGKERKEE